MSKEHDVQLKVSKKKSGKGDKEYQLCIIHYDSNKSETDIRPFTDCSFSKIKEVAEFRQRSEDENSRLDRICQNLPKEFDTLAHGYHRKCYQYFTNIACLKRSVSTESEHENNTSKRSKRLSGNKATSSVLFPSDKCIFCNKEFVKIKGEKQSLTNV